MRVETGIHDVLSQKRRFSREYATLLVYLILFPYYFLEVGTRDTRYFKKLDF